FWRRFWRRSWHRCWRRRRRWSWRERQLLLEFGGGHRLAVTRPATLEAARIGELADNHRLEAGVAHQPGRYLHRIRIVAGDRYRELRIGAVRLAREDHVAHRIEGAH